MPCSHEQIGGMKASRVPHHSEFLKSGVFPIMSKPASELTTLHATERDTTLNPRQLRKAGFVPGTLYAKNAASQNIQVKAHELELALSKKLAHFKLAGPGLNVSVTLRQ